MCEGVIVDIVIDWSTGGVDVRSLTEQLQSFPKCKVLLRCKITGSQEPHPRAGNALTVLGYAAKAGTLADIQERPSYGVQTHLTSVQENDQIFFEKLIPSYQTRRKFCVKRDQYQGHNLLNCSSCMMDSPPQTFRCKSTFANTPLSKLEMQVHLVGVILEVDSFDRIRP